MQLICDFVLAYAKAGFLMKQLICRSPDCPQYEVYQKSRAGQILHYTRQQILFQISQSMCTCIIGLSHGYWWILSRVRISKDASLRASVDIPTRDNIHQYQCDNPFIIQL